MDYIPLITETELKELSLLDYNLSSDYIYPVLKYVQENKLFRILGEDFYNDIILKYTTEDYDYILNNYIKPVLLWGLMSEIQVPLNFKFRNQGMFNTNNPDGNNIILDDIKYTKNHYEKNAKFYEDRLIKHLTDNKLNYPLWIGCSMVKNYNSNITL